MVYVSLSTLYTLNVDYKDIFDEDFIEEIKEKNLYVKKLIELLDITLFDFNLYKVTKRKGLYVYKYIDDRKDSKEYVFKRGGHYVYHMYKDCILEREIIDYKIPKVVIDLKNNEITEAYRKWFTLKFTKPEIITSDLIIDEYNSDFSEKYMLIKSEPEELEDKRVSRIIETELYFEQDKIEEKVSFILQKLEEIKDYYNYEDLVYDLKFQSIDLIRDILKWTVLNPYKNNKNLLILNDFNLWHCSKCQKRHENEKVSSL